LPLAIMSDLLRDLPVLVLDCQAGGATPAYGDLLELGWGVSGPEPLVRLQSHWIARRTKRPISRAVRELTGWSEACAAAAIEEGEAWNALRGDIASCLRGELAQAPTVIHFARFELTFLRDLQARLEQGEPFPLDAICVHTIAARLYPELPRRNIRALAGFLGHSPELLRRARGHVEATAFIWRALLPELERLGIHGWGELKLWLEQPTKSPRRTKLVYPFSAERRRALPDRPGIYRFVRKSGDVLYVGKAASLKKRVASHFTSRGRTTERALEMLTQVHDIRVSETASVLEAALAETDEIKRLDPPYNQQLRGGERSAWFASRDLGEAVATPDERHRIGPLPAERALSSLAALSALVAGEAASPRLLAMSLAVPMTALPEPELFQEGFDGFVRDHLATRAGTALRRLDGAARALWRARGRSEPEVISEEEAVPALWDLARVRRRLERNLIQASLLVRRARFLCLLADADVAFREPTMPSACLLALRSGQACERRELAAVGELAVEPSRPPRRLRERQAAFDAATYDRLRVLHTELRRVLDDGGEVALRFGAHLFAGERLRTLLREI
jgi:DNA polymerase III subunit epsilon